MVFTVSVSGGGRVYSYGFNRNGAHGQFHFLGFPSLLNITSIDCG